MSYTGISIREALDKINDPNGGWYLPQVQRQYVWGARHESETYIVDVFEFSAFICQLSGNFR